MSELIPWASDLATPAESSVPAGAALNLMKRVTPSALVGGNSHSDEERVVDLVGNRFELRDFCYATAFDAIFC